MFNLAQTGGPRNGPKHVIPETSPYLKEGVIRDLMKV
jgi:hypothetical protein